MYLCAHEQINKICIKTNIWKCHIFGKAMPLQTATHIYITYKYMCMSRLFKYPPLGPNSTE